MNENTLLWIWLKSALSDRSVKTYKLFTESRDIHKIYDAEPAYYKQFNFLTDEDRAMLSDKSLDKAQQIIRLCNANSIGIITIDDENYPELLREIYNFPCILFYFGNYEKALSKPRITIVGTRECTTYGEISTAALSGSLATCGFSIVTGVAKGIDTIAINAAIKADGSVIAVIPDGLIATGYNTKYKFRDIRYNGVVISEHLPTEKTNKFSYHERNRILSGLSDGCIVTQAPNKSGALITANYALEQGRDVFALVANADMPQSAGSNALLKDGACPIFGYNDIYEFYKPRYENRLSNSVSQEAVTLFKKRDEEAIRIEDFKQTIISSLTEHEQDVFMLMSHREITTDSIIERTNFPVSEVLAVLSILEAKGAIISCPGNKYKIIL